MLDQNNSIVFEIYKKEYQNIDCLNIVNDKKINDSICNLLLNEIKSTSSEELDTYYSHYIYYIYDSSYFHYSKKNEIDFLNNILNCSHIDKLKIDNLHYKYIYYKHSFFLNKYWFCIPKISFSDQFYDIIIPNSKKLFFNHHQYSSDTNSVYYLPIYDTNISEKDLGIVPRHYLEKKHCLKILEEINKNIKLANNKNLLFECELLEQFINKVLNQNALLLIKSYPDLM